VRRVEQIWGTAVSVDVRDAHDGSDLHGALDGVFAWFTRVDDLFSTWRDDTEVSRIGRGELDVGDASPEVQEVLALCDDVRGATGGAFDVTVGARARAASVRARPEEQFEPWPGFAPVDPSGLVKGWAVDRAASMLQESGARAFSINAGGDVAVRGHPAPGTAWRVGIRHPWEPDKVAAVIAVVDTGVATSGRYERGDHVLDPRTGRPATALASATVVGPDLALADAYATALVVMGVEGLRWIAGLADYAAMAVTDDRRVMSTPGFARHRAPALETFH
jgi:thiamine biosynthesis lipoprotein